MPSPVLKIDRISKQYRLGVSGTGTLSHDLTRWWHLMRGLEDPYLKIGEQNDRTKTGGSSYVWSLRDINLDVYKGEVLGIIGKNGAGKSTLLKILSRVTLPSTGSVKIKGRIASLLEVGTGFHPELTGRENIFLNGAILGMRKAEIQRKLEEIVEFSGVSRYLDTPVKRYSTGMLVRLGFAVAAHLEPEILIVDEVLAVGDAEFQAKCLGKMKDVSKEGRTILFVSHNMSAMMSLCSRVAMLDKGMLVDSGDPTEIIRRYLQVGLNAIKTFTHGPVRSIEVGNDGNSLFLRLHYQHTIPLILPNFGFTINDAYGNVLFGSNPRLSGITKMTEAKCEGEVYVNIREPRLRSGRYSVSIWFGDGSADFFEDKDCVAFEHTEPDRTANSGGIGSVICNCDFKFS